MIITQTPLRISFAGGGTDLQAFYDVEDGMVLSTAIDKYVFVIVSERFDDQIYVNYSRKEIVGDVEQLEHELVREAMKITGVDSGVEITMLADIPSEGSGLGSSSAITVGLLNALFQIRGIQKPAHELAELACEIEIGRCGKPIGKQDQYIAAFGGLRQFRFSKGGSVGVEQIHLPAMHLRELSGELMLFFTNTTRSSSDILTEQRANTESNFTHLQTIREFVPRVRSALEQGAFSDIGRFLHESWLLKRQLASNVSNSEIDEMYSKALDAGAIGGKVAGAGGGGFLLLYVPVEHRKDVRSRLSDYRELPISLERDGSKSIFNLNRPPSR